VQERVLKGIEMMGGDMRAREGEEGGGELRDSRARGVRLGAV
jgi:hypothetical protein